MTKYEIFKLLAKSSEAVAKNPMDTFSKQNQMACIKIIADCNYQDDYIEWKKLNNF